MDLNGTMSRAVIAALREPEHTPTYTLDRQIAEARRRMGEDQWHRLYREFDR